MLALTIAWAPGAAGTSTPAATQRELIPGPDYLRMSYYENWLAGLVELLVKTGLVTARRARHGPAGHRRAAGHAAADRRARRAGGSPAGGPTGATSPRRARFAVGEHGPGAQHQSRPATPACRAMSAAAWASSSATTARTSSPTPTPTAAANSPRRLYGVASPPRELWGEAASGPGSVHLDLWEPILNAPETPVRAWGRRAVRRALAGPGVRPDRGAHRRGAFTWPEWAGALGASIAAGRRRRVLRRWLDALE